MHVQNYKHLACANNDLNSQIQDMKNIPQSLLIKCHTLLINTIPCTTEIKDESQMISVLIIKCKLIPC